MRTIALRLRPGADLKAELLALAARERVQAGWVLTCVGSLSQVRVRLAGGTEDGTWQGAFEIVAPTRTLPRRPAGVCPRARSCNRLRRACGPRTRPVRPGTATGPLSPGVHSTESTTGLWRDAPEKRRL